MNKTNVCITACLSLLSLGAALAAGKDKGASKKAGIPGANYTIDEMVNASTSEDMLKIFTNHDTPPQWKKDLLTRALELLKREKDAGYGALIDDAAFMEIARSNGMGLLSGPMLGQISETGAAVWVRTLGAADVSVQVEVAGQLRAFGPVRTNAEGEYSTTVSVAGLQPGEQYPYTVLVDGKPVQPTGTIRTVDTQNTRIAFGSCQHRWGWGRREIWDCVLARDCDALVMLGDIAVQDRMYDFGLHRFDYLMRDQQAPFQKLAPNMPMYAGWDDHDYLNNDGPRLAKAGREGGGVAKLKFDLDELEEGRAGVRAVFKNAWANPQYGFGDAGGGIFQRTRVGPADIIMTDARYFRGIEGPYLGEGQMKWLEEQLLDCEGPFIILSGGCMWSDAKGGGKDSWGLYDPQGRERIFQLIEKHKISGVLLISGDWHGARVYKIDRPSGYSFYEFEPASLGGRPGASNADKIQDAIFATAGKYAFGEFTFDVESDDPTVTFRMMHEDGAELYSKTLSRSQLTPQ